MVLITLWKKPVVKQSDETLGNHNLRNKNSDIWDKKLLRSSLAK